MNNTHLLDEKVKTVCEEHRIYMLPWGVGKDIDGPKFWTRLLADEYTVHLDFHGDIIEYEELKQKIVDTLEESNLIFIKSEILNDNFYGCEEKLHFKEQTATNAPNEKKVIIEELQAIARKHNVLFRALLDIEGGRGWINYSQIEENDYKIQISTSADFNGYNAMREDIKTVFSQRNAVLVSEENYKKRAFGFQKELIFMDKDKYEKIKAEREAILKMSSAQVFNIGTFNAQGANVVFGDVVNSSLYINNSVNKIKEMIEEKGGEDKVELLSILSEVKEIAEQMASSGAIKEKHSLKERISKHLEKHGWFYGEIVGLLGTVAITVLFGQ